MTELLDILTSFKQSPIILLWRREKYAVLFMFNQRKTNEAYFNFKDKPTEGQMMVYHYHIKPFVSSKEINIIFRTFLQKFYCLID